MNLNKSYWVVLSCSFIFIMPQIADEVSISNHAHIFLMSWSKFFHWTIILLCKFLNQYNFFLCLPKSWEKEHKLKIKLVWKFSHLLDRYWHVNHDVTLITIFSFWQWNNNFCNNVINNDLSELPDLPFVPECYPFLPFPCSHNLLSWCNLPGWSSDFWSLW